MTFDDLSRAEQADVLNVPLDRLDVELDRRTAGGTKPLRLRRPEAQYLWAILDERRTFEPHEIQR